MVVLNTNFGISITGKCNFGCRFCFKDARQLPKGQMSLEEFKSLILEIKRLSRVLERISKTGKIEKPSFRVHIGGGEPFLNPHAVEMVAFAVKHLGRNQVQLTTNMSRLPTTVEKAKELIIKLGKPRINLSIDREHLKFGEKVPEKTKAICTAARELKSKIGIISVVQNIYQIRHPWPKKVVHAIPAELKKGAEIRVEEYSLPRLSELFHYLKATAAGKNVPFPADLFPDSPIMPRKNKFPAARIIFVPGGKVYIAHTPDALHFPQLCIGNWQKESFYNILGENLPFKLEALRTWFIHPKKRKLLARYALRRFRTQRKKRRGR